MNDYIMNRESLKRHCEAMCKKFKDVPTSGAYSEHRFVLDLLEQTEWIPVSERLPEEGEPILLSTKTGEVYEGAYFDLSDNRQWYVYRDENYAWNNVVTAWQPLPKPYKAESEE